LEFHARPAGSAAPSDQPQPEYDDEDSSSSINASIRHDSQLILAQPAEKLRQLLEFTKRLGRNLDLDSLLPGVVETLLQLFPQADRALLILKDESSGELVCRSYRMRHTQADGVPGFRADIAEQCLKTVQGFLSHEPQPALSAPLWRESGQAFGALLLDTAQPKRRFTEDDLNLLMGVATQASIAVRNASYHQQAIDQARLNRDLALAQIVVRSFLPAALPEIPGFTFFASCESAHEVGGDYYDFIPLERGRLAILVGDVSGKGIAASLVMARVSAMAAVCLRTESDLGVAVTELNNQLQPVFVMGRFVTLVALVLDPATRTASLVNAGHPLPMLIRSRTGCVEEINSGENAGLPLGVLQGFAYQTRHIEFQPGDRVVLFSDGVNEAMDANGNQLTTNGVRAILERAHGGPREIGEHLLAAVRQHSANCAQSDDITLVCFGVDSEQ
jgi:serine phosphatase RsbU (regulator of sigma subunit)